jgi:hypothetical protein
MSAWYKMEPLKWDRGADDLTLEQEAALLRIVNAINAADQPIRENYRMLAGMWRIHDGVDGSPDGIAMCHVGAVKKPTEDRSHPRWRLPHSG